MKLIFANFFGPVLHTYRYTTGIYDNLNTRKHFFPNKKQSNFAIKDAILTSSYIAIIYFEAFVLCIC